MMKFMLLLLFLCVHNTTFAQTCSTQYIRLDTLRYPYLMLIRNVKGQVIYQGKFDTAYALPVGTHYYFNDAGQIKSFIEYSFSEEQFEGVPIVIQKSYHFNQHQELEQITLASRCNECEYEPIGEWQWYTHGKLTKTVDASQTDTLQIEAEERYWQLEKQCR
ncbi:hypothetical protein SAMN05421749_10534 [Acinetobacter marinus]|uniref:WG repeat-containing protein n=1 Tax=Acinetobacter marinus TaxID=281375 RepID=A0A1G6LE66_9GAMM|nr:hypothetical protein [Acinetobacter marinus]SDC41494.1 hypothetical protein SAMN05421749_10534 [Acinetobacter marinus]